MLIVRFLGWLLLKLVPHSFFTVIDVEKMSRTEMQTTVNSEWPLNGYHFTYMVERYPGNKWVPEWWQEEYVLGLYNSPDKIWDRLDDVSQKVTEQRIRENDRHIVPDWVFLLIL